MSSSVMFTEDTTFLSMGTCRYGAVAMQATHKGIQSIDLADSTAFLQEQYGPQGLTVHLSESTEQAEWWESLLTYIENPMLPLEAPLDLKGTEFQLEVYAALQRIEPGHTVSYAELALSIQRVNGARALAGACASNSLALAVPCHRVVGSNGAVTGYRWGVSRKSAILRYEATLAGMLPPTLFDEETYSSTRS